MIRLPRLIVVGAVLACGAWAADISGTWNIKVMSPQGEHTAKLAVTQEGEKLSGSMQSDRGEFKVDGTVKGDQIEFFINYTGGDAPTRIPFRGKLEDGDHMKGQYNAGEAGGDWSATKSK